MRIPVTPELHINQFLGGTITELESGITNGVVEVKNNVPYVTQRPSIDIFEDAGTAGGNARGRAIFYWEEQSALYIMNDGTLSKGTQGTSISTSPTAGTKKCYFFVLGSTLVLINPENNEAFTINTSDTVTEITDTDFPPKQTPAVSLAYGGAQLDGYIFVLGTDGIIYNSDLDSATAWSALGFIDAEITTGVYLGQHHDNIAVFGSSEIKFYYNAANATGSPLSKRQDISYNIGCSSGESVWEEGDRMFFVGTTYSGALGVYSLESFQIKKISSDTIDSFITNAVVKDGYSVMGHGFTAQGHTYYLLTIFTTPSDKDPETTLVYDDSTGIWYQWYLTINDQSNFPLVQWTKRQGSTERFGEGILANGDLITIADDFNPQDTLVASNYVADGYVEPGYVTSVGADGTAIELKVRTGMVDGGTTKYKYPEGLQINQNTTSTSQTLTVRWSNEDNDSFNTGKTMDTSRHEMLTGLGRFRRRNHQLEYSGTEAVRIESIELPVFAGEQ